MALAFFGKGIGALGWAVVSDTSPKQIAGLSGALFNTFGNTAAITTPIVIGYLVKGSGGFASALVFVGANAIVAIASYLLVVGEIKRLRAEGGVTRRHVERRDDCGARHTHESARCASSPSRDATACCST